jgi:energy-coupling factor transporter transmembrane protein EcfT
VFIFPVFKINNLIFLFCIFSLWFVEFPKKTLVLSHRDNCTCKKFTKFIINEINKDNFIKEKFYKKTKNRKYTCKQLSKLDASI